MASPRLARCSPIDVPTMPAPSTMASTRAMVFLPKHCAARAHAGGPTSPTDITYHMGRGNGEKSFGVKGRNKRSNQSEHSGVRDRRLGVKPRRALLVGLALGTLLRRPDYLGSHLLGLCPQDLSPFSPLVLLRLQMLRA